MSGSHIIFNIQKQNFKHQAELPFFIMFLWRNYLSMIILSYLSWLGENTIFSTKIQQIQTYFSPAPAIQLFRVDWTTSGWLSPRLVAARKFLSAAIARSSPTIAAFGIAERCKEQTEQKCWKQVQLKSETGCDRNQENLCIYTRQSVF